MSRLIEPAVAMGLVLAWSGAARGDSPALSAGDKETSRALYADGMKALAAKDFVAAEKACGGARALTKVPPASECWARALEGLGRLLEARDAYLEAARYPVKPDEPAVFASAREASRGEADKLAARVPTVTLVVSGPSESTPLRVTLDGATVAPETARLPRKVNPGRHSFDVSADGYAPLTVRVDVGEGEDRRVGVQLGSTGSQPTETSEGAAGLTPSTPPASQPAPSAVVAPSTPAPSTPASPVPAVRNGADSRLSMWIAFGGAAAGLVVGSGAGAMGFVSASNAKSHCTGTACTSGAQGPINDAKTWATVSDVGFVVGGVCAAVGVGFLLWGQPAGAAPTAHLIFGPGSVGAGGTW